jgi:molybdate transport system substrate-binding protein
MKTSTLCASLVASLLVPLCAAAAEITVLSGGAVKSGFTDAAAAWEKKTGHRVKATFAPAGEMQKRLAAGERFDVVVMPAENLPALERDGVLVAGSSRPIASVAIGVAVRNGASLPDISSNEGVKRMLVDAKSLTYMDPTRGTSGKHVDEVVLPKLGVRDEVRAKAKLGEGGMIAEKVASGEVEIAIHQMTEILPVAGVTLVGPLPPDLQKVTVYTGALTRSAPPGEEASALLAYLASAEARPLFLARGYSAP